MALVDFCHIVSLLNQPHGDVGILSTPSHLSPMPPAIPSGSRLQPSLTLNSFGTAVAQKLQADSEHPQKFSSAKWEEYIIQDFESRRVFVDIEVFMKHVLHVPDNWMETWGRAIRGIKRNDLFANAHMEYTNQCKVRGNQEKEFYKPLVDMANVIVKLSSGSPSSSVRPLTPLHYLRNDPKRIFHGIMNELSPDVVAVHDHFFSDLSSGEKDQKSLVTTNLTWAHPLHEFEVKPYDAALVDGSHMLRLKVGSKHEITFLNEVLWLTMGRPRSTRRPCSASDAITVLEEKDGS